MSSEWRQVRVSQLLEDGVLRVNDGYRAKNSELGDAGVPFARAANVREGVRLDGADLLLPESVARAGDKRSRPLDVVFTSKGTVGRFAFVAKDDPEFVYSPQLCFWRVLDTDAIDPQFLFFWMQSDECKRQFNALKGQTDMADYISLRDQRLISISLPEPAEQRRIASVLAPIDEAARAAARLRDRLAKTIQTIVDHEVETKGAGWRTGNLTTLARFVNGRNFTKGAEGTGRPVLRIKELNSGLGPSTVYSETLPADDYFARHFDLLFPWSGSLGVFRWDGSDGLVNQHIFKVIPNDGFPMWFAESWLRRHLAEFQAIARDKATTMGHIQRRHLIEAEVRIPDEAELRRLHAALGPLDELREAKAREATRMSRLREELLSKVVSGKLAVSPDYAARAAEEVALAA
jgi:type I restriction enzyme S subunit